MPETVKSDKKAALSWTVASGRETGDAYDDSVNEMHPTAVQTRLTAEESKGQMKETIFSAWNTPANVPAPVRLEFQRPPWGALLYQDGE